MHIPFRRYVALSLIFMFHHVVYVTGQTTESMTSMEETTISIEFQLKNAESRNETESEISTNSSSTSSSTIIPQSTLSSSSGQTSRKETMSYGSNSSSSRTTVSSSKSTVSHLQSSVTSTKLSSSGFSTSAQHSSPTKRSSTLRPSSSVSTSPIAQSSTSTKSDNTMTQKTTKHTFATKKQSTLEPSSSSSTTPSAPTSTQAHSTTMTPSKQYLPDYEKTYHNFFSIFRTLQALEKANPFFMKITPKGNINGHRSLSYVTLKDFRKHVNGTAKDHVTILLTYGAYGEQIFPAESMLQLITKLLGGYKSGDQFARKLFNNSELLVVPVWNENARMKVEKASNYCSTQNNITVDLEKNFDWEFKETRNLSYSGKRAFSEKETVFIKDIIDNNKIDAYLTFNTGGRTIFMPFSDSQSKKTKRKPGHLRAMVKCAQKMSESMKNPTKWRYGQGYDLLNDEQLSGGRSIDYASEEKRVPFTYMVQMYSPEKKASDCFLNSNPSNDKLQEELDSVYPLYEALLECVIDWKSNQTTTASWKPFPFEDDILNYGLIALVAFVTVSIIIYFCGTKCRCCKRRGRNNYYDEKSMNYNLLDASEDDYDTDEETGM